MHLLPVVPCPCTLLNWVSAVIVRPVCVAPIGISVIELCRLRVVPFVVLLIALGALVDCVARCIFVGRNLRAPFLLNLLKFLPGLVGDNVESLFQIPGLTTPLIGEYCWIIVVQEPGLPAEGGLLVLA